MKILFYVIFVVAGALIGAAQLFLLKKILFSATAGKFAGVPLILFAKLLLYAAAVCITVFFFRDYFYALGIGFGTGMVVGALVLFILQTIKQK